MKERKGRPVVRSTWGGCFSVPSQGRWCLSVAWEIGVIPGRIMEGAQRQRDGWGRPSGSPGCSVLSQDRLCQYCQCLMWHGSGLLPCLAALPWMRANLSQFPLRSVPEIWGQSSHCGLTGQRELVEDMSIHADRASVRFLGALLHCLFIVSQPGDRLDIEADRVRKVRVLQGFGPGKLWGRHVTKPHDHCFGLGSLP